MSAEVQVERTLHNGALVDTSFWVYDLVYHRDSSLRLSDVRYHCTTHQIGNFVSSRMYNGHETHVMNWTRFRSYLDQTPGYQKRRNVRRSFPSYRWPFFIPSSFFGQWILRPTILMDETEQYWQITSYQHAVRTLFISKDDSLVKALVVRQTQSTGAEYYDEYRFHYLEINDPVHHDSTLYEIPDSIIAQVEKLNDPIPENQELYAQAPYWNLQTQYGDSLSLHSLRGKVVVLDFWADGCGPCYQAMPRHQELYETYKDQGFEMVGVFLSNGSPESVRSFLESKGISYPNVLAKPLQPGISKAYDCTFVPAMYVLDRQGNIVKKIEGISTLRFQQLESTVKGLLAENPGSSGTD